MAPVRSMKCMRRPPRRLPRVLASLGRMTSVISDCVLATVRSNGLALVALIDSLAPSFGSRGFRASSLPATMKETVNVCAEAPVPVSAIHANYANRLGEKVPLMSTTDKIAGLKEILALDPKNAFARYGIAMELANRGEVDAALKEFEVLVEQNPDYTAAYFMSAQTLSKAGRNAEAAEKLKAGIACAARTGNRHALSEMQGML